MSFLAPCELLHNPVRSGLPGLTLPPCQDLMSAASSGTLHLQPSRLVSLRPQATPFSVQGSKPVSPRGLRLCKVSRPRQSRQSFPRPVGPIQTEPIVHQKHAPWQQSLVTVWTTVLSAPHGPPPSCAQAQPAVALCRRLHQAAFHSSMSRHSVVSHTRLQFTVLVIVLVSLLPK